MLRHEVDVFAHALLRGGGEPLAVLIGGGEQLLDDGRIHRARLLHQPGGDCHLRLGGARGDKGGRKGGGIHKPERVGPPG